MVDQLVGFLSQLLTARSDRLVTPEPRTQKAEKPSLTGWSLRSLELSDELHWLFGFSAFSVFFSAFSAFRLSVSAPDSQV